MIIKMNNFTNSEKHHFSKGPILSPISAIIKQPREKSPIQVKKLSQIINSRKVSPPHQQMNDLPLIFLNRKRDGYVEYKQLNLNKSKFTKFDQYKSENTYKRPQRRYEANLKNIMKLKKRYSLERSSFKDNSKQQDKAKKAIELKIQIQSNTNENNNRSKLKQLMKNILFQHKIERNMSIYNTSQQQDNTASQRVTQHQKLTNFQRYKSQLCAQNTDRHFRRIEKANKGFKLTLFKTDRPEYDPQKRDRIIIKTQEAEILESKSNDMGQQLSGWENKTTYSIQNKNSLRNNLQIFKAKLNKNQILINSLL